MAVKRFAYGQPVANATGNAAKLYIVEKSSLINVIAANISGTTEITVWLVPTGKDANPLEWIYFIKGAPLANRNTFETFKTAVNPGDTIYASSASGNVTFFVNGIYDVSGITDVTVAAVGPESPQLGSIWINDSVSPAVTKFWNGTTWSDVGTVGPSVFNPVFTRQGTLIPIVGTQRFYVERSGIIAYIRATVGEPSSGSPIVVDILKNGVSVLVTPISLTAGETTSKVIAPTGIDISKSSVSENDYFTVSILSVGSVTAGSNLTVTLEIH